MCRWPLGQLRAHRDVHSLEMVVGLSCARWRVRIMGSMGFLFILSPRKKHCHSFLYCCLGLSSLSLMDLGREFSAMPPAIREAHAMSTIYLSGWPLPPVVPPPVRAKQ